MNFDINDHLINETRAILDGEKMDVDYRKTDQLFILKLLNYNQRQFLTVRIISHHRGVNLVLCHMGPKSRYLCD